MMERFRPWLLSEPRHTKNAPLFLAIGAILVLFELSFLTLILTKFNRFSYLNVAGVFGGLMFLAIGAAELLPITQKWLAIVLRAIGVVFLIIALIIAAYSIITSS